MSWTVSLLDAAAGIFDKASRTEWAAFRDLKFWLCWCDSISLQTVAVALAMAETMSDNSCSAGCIDDSLKLAVAQTHSAEGSVLVFEPGASLAIQNGSEHARCVFAMSNVRGKAAPMAGRAEARITIGCSPACRWHSP